MNSELSNDLKCPITGELFTDPISVPCCTKFFERSALKTHLTTNVTCPLCRNNISQFDIDNEPKNLTIMGLVDTIKNLNKTPVNLPKHRYSIELCPISEVNNIIGELSIKLSDSRFNTSNTQCILVCDTSGSMNGSPIEQVRTSLVHIMSMCYGSNVKPVIICFDSSAKILDIDTDNMTLEEINTVIKRISAGGGTYFENAFKKIMEILEQNQKNYDTDIIFLTDGEDNTLYGNSDSNIIDKRRNLIDDFNEQLGRFTEFRKTVHSIGFGSGCDKVLLEGLRSFENGVFQYAESQDSGDTLCQKITNVFRLACNSSRVDISLNLCNKEFNIELPIKSNKSGEYKMFIDLPEDLPLTDSLECIINSERDTDNKLKVNIIKNSKNQFKRYISKLIDTLTYEIIEILKLENINIKKLNIGIIKQKLDTLSVYSSDTDYDRIKFLSSQLEGDINMGKLLDSRFASTFTKQKSKPNIQARQQQQITTNTETVKKIDLKPSNESNVFYKLRNDSRNEFGNEIMSYLYNGITETQKRLLDNLKLKDIDYTDNDGNNILHLICYRGNSKLLKEILDKFEGEETKKYVNKLNNDNETAVTIAIKARGYNNTLELLLKHGGIIPDNRRDKLEAYCINNKYNRTAVIISCSSNSNNTTFQITEEDSKEYIEYTYKNLVEKIIEQVKELDYDPLQFLRVMFKKCMIDNVNDLLKRHTDLEIPCEFLLDYSLPKRADAEDTDVYIELTNILLEYSPDLLYKSDNDNENCIFKAVLRGSLPHLKLFLEKSNYCQEFLDQPNTTGNTPLTLACSKRYPCIIEELLKHDANPNHVNNIGNVPMYNICRTGPAKIAETLLSYGANAEHVNNGEDTLILIACRHNQVDVLKLLLNYTSIEFVNRIPSFDGFNALFSSVEQDNYECIRTLYDFGVKLDQRTRADNKILKSATLLHLSAFYNRVNATKTLLELGCDPNEVDDQGRTPLMIAVIQGNVDIILLLRTCTNTSILDKTQNTVLSYSRSNKDIEKLLINPAADILSSLAKGLFSREEERLASDTINDKMGIKGVLSKADCINVYDSTNTTPMMYAIVNSNYNMVKLFLELGADPLINNSFGLNSIFYCKWINNKRITELLREYPLNEIHYSRVNELSKSDKHLLYINALSVKENSNFEQVSINYRFEYCTKYAMNEFGYEMEFLEALLKNKQNDNLLQFTDDIFKDPKDTTELNKLIENIPIDVKLNVLSHIGTGESILNSRDLMILNVYCNYNTIDYTYYIYSNLNLITPMINAMDKIHPFLGEVFLGSDNIDRNLFKIDQVITFPLFLSCSTMWRVALNNTPEFTTNKKGTVLLIKSKTGKYTSHYTRDNFNGEVLFYPFTKFRVTNWYIGDVIALGQENIRSYSYSIKDTDSYGTKCNHNISSYLNSNKSLIIELYEI